MTKILLVEDDKSLREIYGVRLLAEGYDIVSAGDGEEALAMAIKEKPQLIVSDVMMPKISGFDMLDILRSTTETKNIKVIMMTALSSDDQRERGEQLGADKYLVKSQVGIEDVVRTVHEVLGDMPSAAGQPQPQAAPSAPTTQPVAPTVPQPPAPSAEPEPVQPAPAAAPPAPSQGPTNADQTLPEPTAPFSTPRPANLGDRVIHPIERTDPPGPDLASRMSEVLSTPPMSTEPAPSPAVSQPATPTASAEPSQPQASPQSQTPVDIPAPEVDNTPPEPVTPVPTPPAEAAEAPGNVDITANAVRPTVLSDTASGMQFEETPAAPAQSPEQSQTNE